MELAPHHPLCLLWWSVSDAWLPHSFSLIAGWHCVRSLVVTLCDQDCSPPNLPQEVQAGGAIGGFAFPCRGYSDQGSNLSLVSLHLAVVNTLLELTWKPHLAVILPQFPILWEGGGIQESDYRSGDRS